MFDLDLIKRNGKRESFVGIDKREQDAIIEYFQKQGVKVKKIVEDVPKYQNDFYKVYFHSKLFILLFRMKLVIKKKILIKMKIIFTLKDNLKLMRIIKQNQPMIVKKQAKMMGQNQCQNLLNQCQNLLNDDFIFI